MSEFVFKPAERKQVSAKVAMVGASGSGKTWSSLVFARGLVGPEGLVAVIDTENDSASMYEGLIATPKQPKGFDVMNLPPPFSVERYIKAIEAAEKARYDAAIVDQASWMWNGQGGLLDLHDQLSKSRKGGGWDAWRDLAPIYNKFVEKLLLSDLHIIVTVRAKAAYADEEDGQGRKKKVKIGMDPIQRPGLEYEFAVVFDLDQANNAAVSKDRTGIFRDHKLPLSIEDGQKLREFLASGRPMTPDEKRTAFTMTAAKPAPKAQKAAVPAAPPSEPVLSQQQRKDVFAKAAELGVSHARLATLMQQVGGTNRSDVFPVAKLEALVEALTTEAAAAERTAADNSQDQTAEPAAEPAAAL